MQMCNQHLFYTSVLQIVLDGTECAEDDTFHPLKVKLQAQQIEQSVDTVQRLFHLFDKKDDVLLGWN